MKIISFHKILCKKTLKEKELRVQSHRTQYSLEINTLFTVPCDSWNFPSVYNKYVKRHDRQNIVQYHILYVIFRSAVARFIKAIDPNAIKRGTKQGHEWHFKKGNGTVRRWIIQPLICTTQWKRRIRFRHRFRRSLVASACLKWTSTLCS